MMISKKNVKQKKSLYVSNLDVRGQEVWKHVEAFQQRAITTERKNKLHKQIHVKTLPLLLVPLGATGLICFQRHVK